MNTHAIRGVMLVTGYRVAPCVFANVANDLLRKKQASFLSAPS